MASLPNFRRADSARSLTLFLACATAAGSAISGGFIAPAPAQAQPQTQTSPVTLPQPGVEPAPSADDPDDALAGAGVLQPEPAPVQPVPRTLDELIPPEGVADPESWAQRGAAPSTEPLALPDAQFALDKDAIDESLLALEGPGAVPAPATIEQQLDAFALTLPEPLEPDEEARAFAELDLPGLEDATELAEVTVTNNVTLALPAEPGAFPEREDVTSRFRDLSALAQLRNGDDTAPQIAARARADEDLLTDILRVYGYYNGEVVRQLSGGRRAGANGAENGARAAAAATRPSVRFDVYPGQQYRFGAIDLGAMERLPRDEYAPLREAFAIQPGDPLLADRIIDEQAVLRVALGEGGYPFARLGEPELLIDHAREEGDLSLPVDPAGRYTFGAVTSSDPEFLSGSHLSRIARFRPGQLYQESLELDLRRAILATGLVSSVTITPRETEPPSGDAPGEVAMDVEIRRAPLRSIVGGIGYGTEDGVKVEATWEHRNLFPPEGALRLRGIVGTRERVASIGFKRNNFRARDQVLFFDLFASDINTIAVESRGLGARATFERLSNFIYQKEFSWQIGAEALVTEERNRRVRIAPGAELPRRSFTIAGVFGSATIDQSDDLLDPTRGYRATLFLAPESSRSDGQQDFYLRAQLDASYYRTVGPAVLAGRLRAATIQGADLNNVAPSRRLYGGGGASVRGYGFQGVGPRDRFGEATGGAALLEASVEARVNTGLLGGAIQVVPFFDIGSVSTRSVPNFDFIRYAAGLGVRYKTSFGPIRVDVGVPLNRSEFDAPVVVFVGIGQAF
jgi:translocation and assembly module TamA